MVVGINVIGEKKVALMLSSLDKKTKTRVEKGIKEAGFFIKGEVVQSISGHRAETKSVDTGRFMGSIKAVFPKKFVAEVISDVEYAKHLEHGTSKIAPRNHFRNSLKRNQKKVNDFVGVQITGKVI